MAISVTTTDLLRNRPPVRVPVKLASRSIKITLVLDPAAVASALRPHAQGDDRVAVDIAVEGRTLRADFNPKSVRKVIAAIREHGPEGVAVLIQGRLMADNSLTDCGLVAQPKTPKPAKAEAA